MVHIKNSINGITDNDGFILCDCECIVGKKIFLLVFSKAAAFKETHQYCLFLSLFLYLLLLPFPSPFFFLALLFSLYCGWILFTYV